MKERYSKSKFKDTMTFKEWYTKNGWEYKSETKYPAESHNIPATRNFKEIEVKIKLFSITIRNDNTVGAINEIRDKYGDCIKHVLRDNSYTEIIYQDRYKEI